MKLIIASLTAATVLASAASAMVQPSQIDPRDAALGAVSTPTTGVARSVPTAAFAIDGRSQTEIGTDSVKVTSFQTIERAFDASDLR